MAAADRKVLIGLAVWIAALSVTRAVRPDGRPVSLLLQSIAAAATTPTVYIIRHGEKTYPRGCLSDAGWERAHELIGIFNGLPSPDHTTFATPQALFANNYNNKIDCERCLQTLTPIANNLSLPIEFRYGYSSELGGNTAGAAAVLDSLRSGNDTILVAWEHNNIRRLTAHLGVAVTLIPEWPDDDYDTVYEITYDHAWQVASFTILAENFTAMSTARL